MNLDDRELRSALARIADDSDPASDLAATVRARVRRRTRVRRNLTMGSLVAAVIATITVTSLVGAPGRGTWAPIGAAPGSSSSAPAPAPAAAPATTAAIPPASSGAVASPSVDQTPSDPQTTPPGERIDQVFISCYATADVGNPDFRNYLGVTVGGGAGTASEALASCTRLWDDGTLSSQPPYVLDQPSDPQHPDVPELTACVRAIPATPGEPDVPTQEIVVVPGDSGICTRLGLETPDA